MTRAIVLGILAVILFGSPAIAQTAPANLYAQTLDDLSHNQGASTTLQYIDGTIKKDPKAYWNIAAWLRDHSIYFLGDQGIPVAGATKDMTTFNSLYFAAFSDLMRQAALGNKQAGNDKNYKDFTHTALLAFYEYEAIVTADAARCEDVSVIGPIQKSITFRENGLEYAYGLVSKETVKNLWTIASATEKLTGARPPNKEICSSGAAKMADLIKQPGVQTKDIPDPKYMGGKKTEVIPPQGYVYQPKYIDDKMWGDKRDEIRAKMLSKWEQQYDAAPKQP